MSKISDILDRRMDLSMMLEEPAPPQEMVIPGFVRGTVGVLMGSGGTGKSWLGLQLMVGLAAMSAEGADTLELFRSGEFREAPAVYLAAEDPEAILWQRFQDLRTYLPDLAIKKIIRNLHVIPLLGSQVRIEQDEWLTGIIAQIVKTGAKLAIFDTFSRFHGSGAENDNGYIASILSRLETIAAKANVAILVIHHVSKVASLSGSGDNAHAARGASALTDNARFAAFLQTMTEEEAKKHLGEKDHPDRKKYVKFGISKGNYTEVVTDRWFMRGRGGVLRPHIFASAVSSEKSTSKAIKLKLRAPVGDFAEIGSADLVAGDEDDVRGL